MINSVFEATLGGTKCSRREFPSLPTGGPFVSPRCLEKKDLAGKKNYIQKAWLTLKKEGAEGENSIEGRRDLFTSAVANDGGRKKGKDMCTIIRLHKA